MVSSLRPRLRYGVRCMGRRARIPVLLYGSLLCSLTLTWYSGSWLNLFRGSRNSDSYLAAVPFPEPKTVAHAPEEFIADSQAPAAPFLRAFGAVLAMLIASMVRRIQMDQVTIARLEGRVSGLLQKNMHDQRLTSEDPEKIAALEKAMRREDGLLSEHERWQLELGKLNDQAALDQSELRVIQEVCGRGNAKVDLQQRTFSLAEIEFEVNCKKPGEREPAPAQFKDPSHADLILADLAELLGVLKRARLLIEGHTAGGPKAMDEFGYRIAVGCAELVKEHLVGRHDVHPCRLEVHGRPGLMGQDNFGLQLVTLAW